MNDHDSDTFARFERRLAAIESEVQDPPPYEARAVVTPGKMRFKRSLAPMLAVAVVAAVVVVVGPFLAGNRSTGNGSTPGTVDSTPPSALGAIASPAASLKQAHPLPSAATTGPYFDGGRGPPNWDNPISGEIVASLQQAESQLPFEPRLPRGLGTPVKILVSPDSEEPANEARGIAFLFDTADYGRVVVVEGRDDVPLAEFEAMIRTLVAEKGKPNGQGYVESVVIKGGTQAGLFTGAHGELTLEWREGNVRFTLSGPTVSKDDIVSLADKA
jgi:hypothetical protein